MTASRYVFDSAATAETGLRFSGLEAIAAGLVDRPALDEAIAFLTTPRQWSAGP